MTGASARSKAAECTHERFSKEESGPEIPEVLRFVGSCERVVFAATEDEGRCRKSA